MTYALSPAATYLRVFSWSVVDNSGVAAGADPATSTASVIPIPTPRHECTSPPPVGTPSRGFTQGPPASYAMAQESRSAEHAIALEDRHRTAAAQPRRPRGAALAHGERRGRVRVGRRQRAPEHGDGERAARRAPAERVDHVRAALVRARRRRRAVREREHGGDAVAAVRVLHADP